jgi:hypothetical protein
MRFRIITEFQPPDKKSGFGYAVSLCTCMYVCMSALLALEIETRNDNCRETGFTECTNLIVVRYSVTNNDLNSNNRFRFQGKVVIVSHIY